MAKKDNPTVMVLKPSELVLALAAMSNTQLSTFIWGPPGIAKSQISQQVATSMGRAFIDVRLSQMDPTDLRGIPYPVVEGSVNGVRWSAPLVLPRNLDEDNVIEIDACERNVRFYNPTGINGIAYCTDPKITVDAINPEHTAEIVTVVRGEASDSSVAVAQDRFTVILKDASGAPVAGQVRYRVTGLTKAVLGFEEFNSAPPSVQAAAYQLILDRRQGEYEVPKDVLMLAMGNRDTDKGVTFKMPTPIANRFVHVELQSDADEWITWALGAMVHPEVVGYISAFKDQLHKFDPGSAARGFQTPRSWTFVSEILENNPTAGEFILTALVIGCVGDGSGVQFNEFRKIASKLPDADQILSGKLKKMEKVEVQLAYALTTTLCYRLKDQIEDIKRHHGENFKKAESAKEEYTKWLASADNFLAFIMDNFQAEIAIMGAKAALSVHRLPFDTSRMKTFDAFADKFKGLIVS
jgi:MoxR-like ATPase